MRYGILVPLCVVVLSGCLSSTAKLGQAELAVFQKLDERLQQNQSQIYKSLGDLEKLNRDAIVDQHALSHSLAKAKLLESMKSAWVQPHSDLVATQKEVAFYLLYELSESERGLVNAKLEERQASIQEVKHAYEKLVSLTHSIIEMEKTVLASLEAPAPTQLAAFVQDVLVETKAFRERLASADNPRLKSLAEEVRRSEERVVQANNVIQQIVAQTSKGR